jgi:hypothetical protein
MSRQQSRHDLAPEMRVRLLEDDLDRTEENVVEAKRDLDDKIQHTKNTARTLVESVKVDLTTQLASLRAEMMEWRVETRAFAQECEDRDDRTRKLLTGLLVSIVTLCVTVTVGVLVALGGG